MGEGPQILETPRSPTSSNMPDRPSSATGAQGDTTWIDASRGTVNRNGKRDHEEDSSAEHSEEDREVEARL